MVQQRRSSRLWARAGAVLALGFALIGATSGTLRHAFAHHGDDYEKYTRLASLVLALVLCMRIFKFHRTSLRTEAPANVTSTQQPSPLWVMQVQSETADLLETVYGKQAVATFVALITDPARYRTRVAETVELEERLITQHVSVEFSLPPRMKERQNLFVPLLSPLKGQLLDNFRLTDAAGGSLADLSFAETTRLAAAGLSLLLRDPLNASTVAPVPPSPVVMPRTPPDNGPSVVAEQSSVMTVQASLKSWQNLDALEFFLLQMLSRRGYVNEREAEREIEDALSTFPLLHESVRQRVKHYVLALSVAYPVVAVVPDDAMVSDTVLLKYERALIPRSQSNPQVVDGTRWKRAWSGLIHSSGGARLLLGVKPFQIVVPLSLPLTSDSYHLRLNGPSNKYV